MCEVSPICKRKMYHNNNTKVKKEETEVNYCMDGSYTIYIHMAPKRY